MSSKKHKYSIEPVTINSPSGSLGTSKINKSKKHASRTDEPTSKKIKTSQQKDDEEKQEQSQNEELESDEIKRPRDKMKRNVKLSEFGNFEKGDRVAKIEPYQISPDESERVFRIFWKERRNGIQPRASFADYEELKHQTPFKIIQWWEGMWDETKKIICSEPNPSQREIDARSGQLNFTVQIPGLETEPSPHIQRVQPAELEIMQQNKNNILNMEIELSPTQIQVQATKPIVNEQNTPISIGQVAPIPKLLTKNDINVSKDIIVAHDNVYDKIEATKNLPIIKLVPEIKLTSVVDDNTKLITKEPVEEKIHVQSKQTIIEEVLEEINKPLMNIQDLDLEEVTEQTFHGDKATNQQGVVISSKKASIVKCFPKTITKSDSENQQKKLPIPQITKPEAQVEIAQPKVISKLDEDQQKKKSIADVLKGLADQIKEQGEQKKVQESTQSNDLEIRRGNQAQTRTSIAEDDIIQMIKEPFQSALGDMSFPDIIPMKNRVYTEEKSQDDFQIDA